MYCYCRSWYTGFENWSIHHGMFYWLSGGSQIFSCVSNFLVGCEPSCVSTCTNGLHDCYVPISNFWNMFNFKKYLIIQMDLLYMIRLYRMTVLQSPCYNTKIEIRFSSIYIKNDTVCWYNCLKIMHLQQAHICIIHDLHCDHWSP